MDPTLQGESIRSHMNRSQIVQATSRELRLQATYHGKPLIDVRWRMAHSDAHILKEG